MLKSRSFTAAGSSLHILGVTIILLAYYLVLPRVSERQIELMAYLLICVGVVFLSLLLMMFLVPGPGLIGLSVLLTVADLVQGKGLGLSLFITVMSVGCILVAMPLVPQREAAVDGERSLTKEEHKAQQREERIRSEGDSQ